MNTICVYANDRSEFGAELHIRTPVKHHCKYKMKISTTEIKSVCTAVTLMSKHYVM